MKIDLTIEGDFDCDISTADLELITAEIADKLDVNKIRSAVEVFLVSNDKIRQLNKEYRQLDAETDVLSFPQKSFPAANEEVLGTIFIAPDFAKSEKTSCNDLFIHGLLHLMGYDHETNINDWRTAEEKIGGRTI